MQIQNVFWPNMTRPKSKKRWWGIDRIAVIRNQEVIADADVAYLYGVETREVNQAVKNNPEKFPAHYMFELTPSELRDLKSKVLISN